MNLIVKPGGVIITIYSDAFEYKNLGEPHIRRVSKVEPTQSGLWIADLSLVDGPILGPFEKRCDAIDAELEYVNLILNECNPLEEHLPM